MHERNRDIITIKKNNKTNFFFSWKENKKRKQILWEFLTENNMMKTMKNERVKNGKTAPLQWDAWPWRRKLWKDRYYRRTEFGRASWGELTRFHWRGVFQRVWLWFHFGEVPLLMRVKKKMRDWDERRRRSHRDVKFCSNDKGF